MLDRMGLVGRKAEVIRKKAASAALKHLIVFTMVFLPHLALADFSSMHYELCSSLDWAVGGPNRLVGALPREHAKTTIGTVALVLREACRGNSNIMIIGANRDEASVKLRQVVRELESNALLKYIYGPAIRPAIDRKGHRVAYGDQEVVLHNGTRIVAIGAMGKVRGQLSEGRRLDLVVLDDPEDDVLVESPAQRAKLRQWTERALLNALAVDSGSLVWLGTILHHDSALAQWLDCQQGNPNWRTIRYAALDCSGEPIWPARWSKQALEMRRREIGERAFAQEYLNRPVSATEQLFRAAEFRTYDLGQYRRSNNQACIGKETVRVVAGVDPASGQGASHDYFAAAVIGADESGSFYLLNMTQAKLRFPEQVRLLFEMAETWKPSLLGIETVQYQQALLQQLQKIGLPAKGLGGTASKQSRIEQVALLASQGRILIPHVASWLPGFLDEAEKYPAGKNDDQLDALARAIEIALPLGAGAYSVDVANQKRGYHRGYA